ncbi:MAG: hypothetical protein HKN68_21215 [Saprospiraceae bacterium]|nr:hypothetical protein [Saprospiraceae bacterium]
MMKFFRKIRQNLLTQNKPAFVAGRFSKYLLYAIGEIILVVIGILIALNINNRNTINKERALEQDYLIRLSAEIEEEVAYYNTQKLNFENQNKSITRMLERWKLNTRTIMDTTQFFNDFFAGNGLNPWFKEPVIWTQLVQSGELSLIHDPELIEGLYRHYAEVNLMVENFKEYPTQTTNEARKLMAITFISEDFLTKAGSERPSIPSSETLTYILENQNKYKELFVRVAIIARIHSGIMNKLSKSATEVLHLLEKRITTQ